MIPSNILNNTETEIVVSYGIMHGQGTNPMGHAYLLFSYYCPETKRMVVDDAIGLYSTLLPAQTWGIRRAINEASFFDDGHLLQEQYRYLINQGTSKTIQHYHKSWKINATQYNALIENLKADRGATTPIVERNFSEEYREHIAFQTLSPTEKAKYREKTNKAETHERTHANGPKFDIVKNSCKTDALKRLAAVGIATQGIHNRLIDLPIYSGKISEHELGYDPILKKMIWQTPLELSPQKTFEQESIEMQNKILAQRQYHLLMNNLNDMITLFDLKIKDLMLQSPPKKTADILTASRNQLQNLLGGLKSNGMDPAYLTTANIDTQVNNYKAIIQESKNKIRTNLKPHDIFMLYENFP